VLIKGRTRERGGALRDRPIVGDGRPAAHIVSMTHTDGYRTGINHLRTYIAREGHANVSKRHIADDGFKLGRWVVQRRHDRKVGQLSTAKVTELNTLGMVWDARAA